MTQVITTLDKIKIINKILVYTFIIGKQIFKHKTAF